MHDRKRFTAIAALAAAAPIFDPGRRMFALELVPTGMSNVLATSTKGYGSSVTMCATLAGTYVPIAQCRDIKPPGFTVEADDVSHMSSANQAKEKDTGWSEASTVTLNLLFTKTQYNTLYATKGTKQFFKVIDADGSMEGPFQGFVSNLSRALPMQGRVTADCEITPCADVAFTPAA